LNHPKWWFLWWKWTGKWWLFMGFKNGVSWWFHGDVTINRDFMGF
jgi:hypothetical protein